MKEYKDVKRAAEAALRGLMRSIYENLDDKEADTLYKAKIDFDRGNINEADTF